MTTDLQYLAFTAILTATLWVPYVVAQVLTNGPLQPANYLDPTPRPLPPWGRRADRVHINGVETFAPFAALVIVAHISGKADSAAFWAMTFFWARLVHAIVYWLGVPFVRTLAFVAGWSSVLALFWIVVR